MIWLRYLCTHRRISEFRIKFVSHLPLFVQTISFLLLLLPVYILSDVSFRLPKILSLRDFGISDIYFGQLQLGLNIVQSHPDQERKTCDIVRARAFRCETHQVLTYGGYLIDVHRIPPSSIAPTRRRTPVLLQNGLTGTSAQFVFSSDAVPLSQRTVGQNLGFELAKRGYDVWILNNRGGTYGRRHLRYAENDARFWQWTFDDIAREDTPAFIHYVRRATGSYKVHYIGNSQGAAVMFALLSKTSKYDSIVQSFIAITPITRIGGARTIYRPMIAAFKPILKLGGPALSQSSLSTRLRPMTCAIPIGSNICKGVFFSISGPNDLQLNMSRLSTYSAHSMSPTSAQNLLHFDQLFRTNRFAMYDFGIHGNQARYGTPVAPEYDLTRITHRNIYVIYGQNDYFVPLHGIEQLRQDLRYAREFYPLSDPRATHADPLTGISTAIEVNTKIIEILSRYP